MQLQLEKGAQTTEEGGAVFALFGRLILGEMSVFDNALGLHFSFCQQLTAAIERAVKKPRPTGARR